MRYLRAGFADVTMVAGVGAATTWKDPDLMRGTPTAIVLEDAPDFYEIVCTTRSGGINVPTATVTATSVTLAGDAEDAGVYRVFAVVRMDDLGI